MKLKGRPEKISIFNHPPSPSLFWNFYEDRKQICKFSITKNPPIVPHGFHVVFFFLFYFFYFYKIISLFTYHISQQLYTLRYSTTETKTHAQAHTYRHSQMETPSPTPKHPLNTDPNTYTQTHRDNPTTCAHTSQGG